MLERRKTPNKNYNQQSTDLSTDNLIQSHNLPILPPSNITYGESFLTGLTSSLAEKGYQEYLTIKETSPSFHGHIFTGRNTGNYSIPTPSSSSEGLYITENYSIDYNPIYSDSGEMHPRSSNSGVSMTKRLETPPESPRSSVRMGGEQREWGDCGPERSLRRQYSSSSHVSQVSRGLSKRNSGRFPQDSSHESTASRLALERLESNASQVSSMRSRGELVRSYSISNAIVAPTFSLARGVSIPSINEDSALAAPIPFPIRARPVPENFVPNSPPQNSIMPVQKVKVSRSIRSFFKGGFGNSGQSAANEPDDNSSEEGDRNSKGSKKSMFNLRKQRVKESEERPACEPEPHRRPTSQYTPQPPSQPHCTKWCGVPRCFHDCDVLHIKNSAGHDCLVIEMVAGTPTIIAGTLEGLLVELCAPINDRSDPSFTDRFLRTCGNFCSPIMIMKMLAEQHEKNRAPQYQRRVIEILIRWLRIQPEDLFEGEQLSPILKSFVKEINQYNYQIWGQELQSTCEKVSKKVESYSELCKNRGLYSLDTLAKEAVQTDDSAIMELGNIELAKYFAALDLILFRDASENRTVRAWFRRSIASTLKTAEDPILVERVDRVLWRSEMIKDWVAYQVLRPEDRDVAISYIEKFIDIAKILCTFGNFQTSLAIVDAVASETFEEHHEEVSVEKMRILNDLKLLMTEDGYTKALSEAPLPVVPSLTKFLQQVENAEAGMSYYRDPSSKKRHMDLSVDRCGYAHYSGGNTFRTSSRHSQDPPYIYDITKHGLFYHHIHLARQKAWRAHSFDRVSRQAWVFNMFVPGRSAFCKTTLGEKPNRDSNLTQESLTPKHSMMHNRQNSINVELNSEHAIPTSRRQGRSTESGKYPPSPPITPPTSTYFDSKRISAIGGPGGLDWLSEPVEKSIIEAYAFKHGIVGGMNGGHMIG